MIKNMQLTTILACAVAAPVFWGTFEHAAASTNTVEVYEFGSLAVDESIPNPITLDRYETQDSTYWDKASISQVHADAGTLSVNAEATVATATTSVYSNSTFVKAGFILDDVIFSALPGTTPADGYIYGVNMNFELSGQFTGDYGELGTLYMANFTNPYYSGRHSTNDSIDSGILADLDGFDAVDGLYTTNRPSDYWSELNTPTIMGLGLTVSSYAQAPDGSSYSTWDYGSTTGAFALSFPTDGSPVFVLPEGYTANSISGNIVDNVWVGASAVPIPGALWLMGSGLAGLVGLGSRRYR